MKYPSRMKSIVGLAIAAVIANLGIANYFAPRALATAVPIGRTTVLPPSGLAPKGMDIWFQFAGKPATTSSRRPNMASVPADYNGDRSADLAVYRPSTGIWFVWSCTNNPAFNAAQFGAAGDRIVPSADRP